MNTWHKKIILFTGALLLVFAAGSGQAEDIDIYYGNPATSGSEPVVMFSLDWRPNLGSPADCSGTKCDIIKTQLLEFGAGPYTFFDVLRAVLALAIEPLDGVRVGLMMSHDYKNNCAGPISVVRVRCSNGGFIAVEANLFETLSKTITKADGSQEIIIIDSDVNGNKAKFNDFLVSVPLPQGNASHKYQGKELFFELYRYLTGQAVYNGHIGFLDFQSNPNTNMDEDNDDFGLPMWDEDAESSGIYESPLQASGRCTKAYTINLLFQVSQQDSDSDSALIETLANGGMGGLAPKPTFPDVIEWLNDADLGDGLHGDVDDLDGDQNVTSFFIVDPSKINTTTTAYARAGGTGAPLPLDEDPEKLITTITDTLAQILSVSTTFVAASIPVNVFNRAEIVDNVFIALFQPDAKGRPYWVGNVKKLSIGGLDVGSPVLEDANGDPAIAADGRLRPSALTLWTDPDTLLPADPKKDEVDGKDGRTVDRGGAGQKIPGFIVGDPGLTNGVGTRQLFYNEGASLAALNADALTAGNLQAALGAADADEAKDLLAWARGLDIDDEDGDGDLDEARDWIFADPLHSRPLPMNFGARSPYTKDNPAIYIAVASNDGFLHMFRNLTPDGDESGEEAWAFMPTAVMGTLSTLRTNAAGIRHPYMLDGSPVAWLDDSNANGTIDIGERAWLFGAMRRGGKGMYALDISDPEDPELLWTLSKGGDFAELGYTFSNPRVILIPYSGGTKPALIFGGGYDFNKDQRGGTGTDDTEGNAVYIVDAETGTLIWKATGAGGVASSSVFLHADFTDSTPSELAVFDSDGDSHHDRAYFGDSGGNAWRVDFAGADTSKWKLTLLAKLGRHAGASAGQVDDRRFFHRPDIVQSFDKFGKFDAVVMASGNRSDPKDVGGTVENWAYMIKDRAVGAGSGLDSNLQHGNLGDITDTCLQKDAVCTADLTLGWRLQLTADGEKSLATALTIGNTVYFTTYLPQGSSEQGTCGPSEGSGRLYAVSLKEGYAINNYDTTTEDLERYTDLDSKGIPAEVVSLPPNSILRPDLKVEDTNTTTRFETYWFEEEDTDL